MRLRIAIFFSGGGTTLQNLIDATGDGRLPNIDIVQAISSRAGVGGIARCERHGITCVVAADPEHAASLIDPAEVDLIVLAGWMRQLTLDTPWIDRRVINVHPSLLPSFGGVGMFGRHVHEAVLATGCRVTGCTVHYVDNGLDTGPIIEQQCVRVQDVDTPESLAARVQAAEREALVAVLTQLSS